MNLADVMDEAASVLEGITGLRVSAWPPGTIVPPAGYISYPQAITFDATYGRGVDRYTGLPLTLLAGKVTDRTARNRVGAWANGGGPASVKALTEAHTWTTCGDFTITGATFDVETVAGVEYLAVILTADVIGNGA